MSRANKMVDDLDELNKSGAMGCPPEVFEKAWASDMIWYGPGESELPIPFRATRNSTSFRSAII